MEAENSFEEAPFREEEEEDPDMVAECPYKKFRFDCDIDLDDASFATSVEDRNITSTGDDTGNQPSKPQDASSDEENGKADCMFENGESPDWKLACEAY